MPKAARKDVIAACVKAGLHTAKTQYQRWLPLNVLAMSCKAPTLARNAPHFSPTTPTQTSAFRSTSGK